MPFGDDLAVNVFIARFAGQDVHGGWAWKDGSVHRIRDLQLETAYRPDGRTHESLDVSFSVDGERLEAHGDIVSVAPVPYPMGDKMALINEGLCRWRIGDRETLGIAEYLHHLGDQRVSGPAGALLS